LKKFIALTLLLFSWSVSANAQKAQVVGQSFAPLVKEVLPSVVNISTIHNTPQSTERLDIVSANEFIRDYFLQDEGGHTSLGSGFIIDSKGYIITNNHVIENADEIIVKLADDSQFNASVIGTDKMTDIALIKIDSSTPLPFVKIGDSDKLEVGDWILAVGNPFGLGGSVTAGIVSAKSRDIDAGSYDNFIQTDAAINQGSSGGPMFNMNGEVVGINTAIFSSSGGSVGIGFATPINLSKFVVEQLIAKGKVERGWLGLKVSTNSQAIILSDSQTFKDGVIVSSLAENSPATTAGIEAGDVIISFNGNDIKDAKSFSRSVAETSIGQNVILRIWRNSQIKDVNLTIAPMPEKKATLSDTNKSTYNEKPIGYVEELGIIAEEKNEVIIVSEVLAGSDAFTKGLKEGDIIQKIDGKEVFSIDDLLTYVAYAKTAGGPPVEMRVLSDGMPQTLQLKVVVND